MGEDVYFDRDRVLVTPTRFAVRGKTYAVRNIVSTRGITETPGCLGWLFGEKTRYAVVITTSAG
jgi:hypothetical protein